VTAGHASTVPPADHEDQQRFGPMIR
jgi:hypothetical protein